MSRVTNALSFDLEHWYTATLLREHVTNPRDRVRESTRIVLDLLAGHDVTATFFVVGEVAEKYPDLVAEVADAGHEIGSHGHTHRPLSELDRETFRRELHDSADAIERAIGHRPAGFRAPNFSVNRDTRWAFPELRDAGFRYDSSVFPVRTPMYGVSGAPVRPYAVDSSDPFAESTGGSGSDFAGDSHARWGDLYEVPVAVFDPRVRIPIAGGFYGRVLPRRVLAAGIRNLNRRGIPATLYFHPWEFDPAVVRDDVPLVPRVVSFRGVEGLRSKLDGLLSSVEFGPVGELLDRELGTDVAAVEVEE